MSEALNRRGFLGLAGGLGLAAMTGCGADGGADAASQPKSGGRLRAVYAGGGAKEVLDPHVQSLFVDIARHKAMYEKLVELGPDLKPLPRLAEKWEPDAQAATWRFTLRDATFHDGQKLTAEDVLYSLSRMADPTSPERVAQSSLATLDLRRCRAVDQRTVELTLTAPNAEFPALLAGIGTQIVRNGFKDPTKPIGTGPFTFVSFEAGRSMVARRYDDYWDGAARIEELHVLSADAEARANALQGGQAEYANEMTATFARTAEAGKTVKIVAAKASTTQAFVMKVDQAPFDNPDVRMAFKLLADRQRLVDVVLAGRGQVANDLFGKGFQYYPADLPQRERNVEEAKALLKKAGALNKEFEIYTSDASAGFVEAATLFAEQVAEAGVKLKVTTGGSQTYAKDLLTKGMMGSHRSGAMPIPQYITDRLLSKSPFNVTHWRRPAFDAGFAAAQVLTDEVARSSKYSELQKSLRDEGGILAWGHPDYLVAVSSKVEGVQAVPPNTLDSSRFDKVWLA
ncbi:peptide/nickel transport system substrate-binding protein [Kribbella sp. VKM Ac-2527]|uniref:Peptide/nickel transport system substrate-binding protein n=1 Tax=Kribbella caucasensis TaxID=2512215 RepID=A0A4R6K9G5_9ACTN|nr:ABC transporter substrate-binding protein [Kribbella sp. VKM Ac-2527]TDO45827.1 peptide/nickel transport system substrate-binding protein [Kribbella sp. VKM Ac-2527]